MVAAAVFVLDLRPRLVVNTIVIPTPAAAAAVATTTTTTTVCDMRLLVWLLCCLFVGWWAGGRLACVCLLYCVFLQVNLSVACSCQNLGWFRVQNLRKSTLKESKDIMFRNLKIEGRRLQVSPTPWHLDLLLLWRSCNGRGRDLHGLASRRFLCYSKAVQGIGLIQCRNDWRRVSRASCVCYLRNCF